MSDKSLAERVGYTPGPWKLNDEFDFDSFISGDTGKFQDVICQPPNARKKPYKRDEYPPWDNNKRIILAAPQMFEALVKIKKALEKIQTEESQLKAIAYIISSEKLAVDSTESATGLSWEELNS